MMPECLSYLSLISRRVMLGEIFEYRIPLFRLASHYRGIVMRAAESHDVLGQVVASCLSAETT